MDRTCATSSVYGRTSAAPSGSPRAAATPGDAQIFIDLADNPRLDHNYTAFAQVTRGMDVVDAILEGAVIERVEILEQP